jgi:hypothetical protein
MAAPIRRLPDSREWVGLAFLRSGFCSLLLMLAGARASGYFFEDGPESAGVAPPLLLISAPRIAAALSRPVP